MSVAKVAFGADHDMAAIRWSRRPNDWPVDAINRALAALYQNEDLAPFIYLVYDRDGETCLGMLVAGNFNPENDAEIRAQFSDIVSKDEIAPETEGPFANFEVQV